MSQRAPLLPGVEIRFGFNLFDGHIFDGQSLVLFRTSPTTAMIDTEIRAGIDNERLVDFDTLVFEMRQQGIVSTYVGDLEDEFDKEIDIDNFLESENVEENRRLNAFYKIGLTEEEITAVKHFNEIKASITDKLVKRLMLPKLPRMPVETTVDLDDEFDYPDRAAEWLNGASDLASPKCQCTGNLLRISSDGKEVETITGHSVPIKSAKAICKHAIAGWARSAIDGKIITYFTHEREDRSVEIFSTYIKIGCQCIPRCEVERIAAKLEQMA